ncbi:NADH-quinone oxidoreductase subunit NuoN [candidate division KSB1 bacterium]|nr:NADH-quinone oxidoreductase subunit NuoN [candidate division KSB1 bacterium]
MNFDPIFLIGEFSLVALIVILTLVDAMRKPVFALLGSSAEITPDIESRNRQATWIAGIGLVIVAAVYFIFGKATSGESVSLLHDSLRAGGGVYIGKLAIIGAGILTILLSARYTMAQSIPAADYYLLLCFSLLGALTLIAAENFLMIFLSLEMMSIPIYALVGLKRYNSRVGESAIKYLLLGGLSSAFLLLGISFIYGMTGTLVVNDVLTHLSQVSQTVSSEMLLMGLGLVFIFVGLAFKVSLVPFHAWTPDVYEGAATPVTSFMSVAVKLAAFAVILKIFAGSLLFPAFDPLFSRLFAFFALLTIIYGNSVAIVQKNVKRMLAYSSIAHAGYMALALAPMGHNIEAVQAVLFYGIGYIAMNMLAFGVLVYLTYRDKYCETLEDLTGIARKYPGAAAVMSVAMFSLGGLPPAVGFVGKVQIFLQLINGKFYATAVIALLFSMVALYFYINVIVVMYMKEPEAEVANIDKKSMLPVWLTLGFSTLFILILGILPSPLMEWSLEWAKMLF